MKKSLTPEQEKALESPIRLRDEARAAASFEAWFMCNSWYDTKYDFERGRFASFEDAVNDEFLFFAKRDGAGDVDGYIANRIAEAKEYYEEFRSGIVYGCMSSNTLRALERKGVIEILEDGGKYFDKFRIIES